MLSSIDLIGLGAGLLTTGAFLPQALKAIRTRHTADLSLAMYVAMAAGNFLWLAYGLALPSWPLIAANSVTLGLTTAILLLKLRYG